MAGHTYASFPYLSIRRADFAHVLKDVVPMHVEDEDDEFVMVYFRTAEDRDAVQTSCGGLTTLNTRPSTDVRLS
ncbi:hypothetical protein GCM10008019_21200 [Deinococcus soli (ex Cha et al. 2016)]|nr:hypothetical protein GCM10008019_21200 [Deinococcus soli (ex Cha et al. 2016)]